MHTVTRNLSLSVASMAAVMSIALATPNIAGAAPPDDPGTSTSTSTQTPPTTDPPPTSAQTDPTTEQPTTPPATSETPSTSETAPPTSEAPSSDTPAPSTSTPAVKKPQARAAVAAGCQTYPPTSYQICGVIRDKYNQMNGPNSFLLFPKSNELTNPNNTGKRTEFLGGNIYWSTATGAHPVAHDFLTKWGEKGYEGGYLKYPTTDEIPIAGGLNGRRQEYQGGSIYFEQTAGAHTIQGAIKDKWVALGAQTGALGYPTGDETVAPDGKGRYNYFQNGAVYWSPNTGAHAIFSTVLKVWGDANFESGKYGYPTGEQTTTDNNTTVKQVFQGGVITAPGQKFVDLSKLVPLTNPEGLFADGLRAIQEAGGDLQSAVDQALNEAKKLAGGGHDTSEGVPVPEAKTPGDIFYSDGVTHGFQHGHNGIYASQTESVQALNPEKGVQIVPSNDPDHVVYYPRLMSVVSTPAQRAKAVYWAVDKSGSGYNEDFAFNKRDWKDGERGTYNCSQLVWAAYMNASGGSLDLDFDGGQGVYPNDILQSPYALQYQTAP